MKSSSSSPAADGRLLSNGRLSSLLTAHGTGYCDFGDTALTRWRGDALEDADGYFVYLRDCDSGQYWSVGAMPLAAPGAVYDAGQGWISCTHLGIEARLDISIALDADIELRALTLRNTGATARRIEVTSYLEVVLNARAAEASHPAFSKLFVQTEALHARGALLARRRPRGADETGIWLVHAASGGKGGQFETDRKRFIGRGGSLAAPHALARPGVLSGTAGNVLDPAMSLRREIGLAPGAQDSIVFMLGVAADREGAVALLGDAPTQDLQPHVDTAPIAPRFVDDAPGEPLQFFNGDGGFSADGKEYVIRLKWDAEHGLSRPPLPWTNVIANEQVGVLVSETGAGYTWSRNSREHRLTPWSNDPVCDPHGEAIYLRDESDAHCWSPMPGPIPAAADYEAVHGFGYTTFRHVSRELEQESTVFVARHDPVKLVRIKIRNTGAAPRTLSLFSYQQLVMGSTPLDTLGQVDSSYTDGMILATNGKAGPFADGVAFSTLIAPASTALHHSADRAAFIGMHGSTARPAALGQRQLDGRTGVGLDACAAFQAGMTLAPGAQFECTVLLGEASSREQALALVAHYRQDGAVDAALAQVKQFWQSTTGTIEVNTPVKQIDLMVNGWLAYQNLSCRIWGRSAFYQSGGAIGYRDQLQDSSAMIYTQPAMTRRQICLHAAHQFVEGDVLHWWHPAPLEKGLRTRFSDDLLWLPWITAFYIRTTGDAGVLDEVEGFLEAPLLAEGEDEVFLAPSLSDTSADVYEHCCRALDRSLTMGAHGLPLMGTGDWNDGMNRVGREGRGESVWMGFFLYRILTDFLPLCEARGDGRRVLCYRAYRDHLSVALNEAGWDGQWYRRAFYDNGAVMGSVESDECRIDALAQAWAVISGAAPPERAAQALDAMESQLISDTDGLIRLLTPPFVDTPQDPGYIKGYVAGVRENGGQYTHAACWAVRAVAEAGRGDRAAQLLQMISPVSHALTPEAVARYQVEPYVIAADIYGADPHVGRGGWTWYTGSAGWMYRVALESVLGFTLLDGRLIRIAPVIPSDWPEFTITYRPGDGATVYRIRVINDSVGAGSVVSATMDGVPVAVEDGAALLPILADGAEHAATVLLRAA